MPTPSFDSSPSSDDDSEPLRSHLQLCRDRLATFQKQAVWQSRGHNQGLLALAQLMGDLWGSDRVSIFWECASGQIVPVAQNVLEAISDDSSETGAISLEVMGTLQQREFWAIADFRAANLPREIAEIGAIVAPGAESAYLVPVKSISGTQGFLCCAYKDSARWRSRSFGASWTVVDELLALYGAQVLSRIMDDRAYQELQTHSQHQGRSLHLIQAEFEQAAQAWQESQRFIQSIAHASTCIVYIYDRTEDRTIYTNQQLTTVLGYSVEAVTAWQGMFLEGIIHPEERSLIQHQRQQWAQLETQAVLQIECRVLSQAQQWRWLLIREAIFNTDATGEPTQIIGTATDITQLKMTESALRAANTQLHRLAVTDELTQLANRRHFDLSLQREWFKMAHLNSPLSLILADIDYFKHYNDARGHQAGDHCLQNVAHLLLQTVKRTADTIARYGGEEFALLLPSTDAAGAIRVAQRIQAVLREHPLEHPQSAVSDRITLSLGVATVIPTPLQECHALVAAADQALYKAKSAGRNQYCVMNLKSSFPNSHP